VYFKFQFGKFHLLVKWSSPVDLSTRILFCRQIWLCTTNTKFYRKQWSTFVDAICERTADLVITFSFAALYAKTHVIKHAGLCSYLDDSTLVCFLLSQGSRQPCFKNVPFRWQKVGSCFCLAVWHMRLTSCNYEWNYATCFWPDVTWYTNYNRKGRLLSCSTLSR
jgi:hypothetical protein